jgi:cytochrome P450
MLSFLFHYLFKTPRAYQAIRDEVDRVCGNESVRYEHLQKFKYIDAALKETLRLKSTAPAWAVIPKKDEVIGGFYKVDKGQTIVVVLDALHRDPKVWGDDVEDFRPERMLDGRFEALPPDAWKPFGQCPVLGHLRDVQLTFGSVRVRQRHARLYRQTVRLARIVVGRWHGKSPDPSFWVSP